MDFERQAFEKVQKIIEEVLIENKDSTKEELIQAISYEFQFPAINSKDYYERTHRHSTDMWNFMSALGQLERYGKPFKEVDALIWEISELNDDLNHNRSESILHQRHREIRNILNKLETVGAKELDNGEYHPIIKNRTEKEGNWDIIIALPDGREAKVLIPIEAPKDE